VSVIARPHERNREGREDYDITWHWAGDQRSSGFTAVMRVKNEARNLPFVLPALLRSVERVVLIDNDSDDGTSDVARRVAGELELTDRLRVLSYPFAVARCGSEHLNTAPDSVHSLTYYYNWAFSHVSTRYGMKWDGDMVLTEEGEQVLRDLAWQLEATEVVLPILRVPVYVESADVAWVDVGVSGYYEPCGWPNTPAYRFIKGFEWEVPIRPDDVPTQMLPSFTCFELKWLDSDEFSNWTGDDFITSRRSARKQKDWRLFTSLRDGRVPPELVKLERGAAEHVVEVIRTRRRAWWEELAAAVTR
jgi:glycosyltransferase involved in cell wall biosynthesis